MAKTVLKNIAQGARGVNTEDEGLVMVDKGATSRPLNVSSEELKSVIDAGYFEKGKASDAPEEQESQQLGVPGPGDPPAPEDAPENEAAADEGSTTRRKRG